MALLLDNLLIDNSDFKEFADVTKTMLNDIPKMELYIREAQVAEIRTFLGDELYLKMVLDYNDTNKNFDTQRYNDIWEGIDYDDAGKTKRSHGLKAAHVYYALSRIIKNNSFNITRFGNKDLTQDSSTSSSIGVIKSKINQAKSQALIYQNECKRFLDLNLSTYPEFANEETKGIKTGIQFKKL
jgi:hypothetical protein